MSLQLRLLLFAVAGISAALALAAFILVAVFDRHVRTRYIEELDSQLIQLSALVRIQPDGHIAIRHELYDPVFQRPLSGHYWQVNEAGQPVLRSQSLWDAALDVPRPAANGWQNRVEEIIGPRRQPLILVERSIVATDAQAGERRLQLVVAGNRRVVDESRREFVTTGAISLAAIGGLLALASWLQVRSGLAPLRSLARQVEGLRAGRRERLEGHFPGEMSSFVDALNRLISAQAGEVDRARANAGKLGHGLKTPLAVVAAECRALRSRGEHVAAASIEKEIGGMNMQITRAIAAARTVGPRQAVGTRTLVEPLATRMVGVMRRLPRGAELDWQIEVRPRGASLPVDQRDLEEMLGNLLDNARKWARANVTVRVDAGGEPASIAVEDDGPGIPEDRHADVLAGGWRLDRSVPGSGLGLAIANDIAALHGGRISIGPSVLGGTRAALVFGGSCVAAQATDAGPRPDAAAAE